ncbi:DNA primase [Gemmatimonas groenlandica]|uniref:DNA primase n=1 Tax=Gemmatimonas groenlandica TaxID=2732249 RepID=A0A6M4ILZ7_9BACT|nr:DNA primase [Gemmatimonas groenlandica]QJR34898.1 DNA primase [Gemmatimonas groenlandica]
MISDEIIERVRTAADIVQIISEFVPLKRAGGDYRGPCPFHGGTNPNFSVSPKRGSYHCFVCHESGDVFSFVRKRLGLDWPSAVKMIGERVGIDVIDVPMRAQASDPNAPNFEVLAAAAEWFQRQLTEEATGRDARAYLQQRQLDDAAWERFGLGFAPRDLQALRRYLHSLGADDARLIEAGLFVVREGETEPRPRFRGRLMFPILDELGRHVGFGGRALGDDTPKYLNSPESVVFQKRKTLYNMHTAKQAMRRAGRAIVVEGYLDAIRLVLAGIEEVVAPLGTALTDEQAQLLVRYAPEVFLLYDSDEAGQKATFRSGLELLGHKATVRVVTLPENEDPDTFVRDHGRAAMDTQLSLAIDLFDRQVQMLERLGWFSDLRRRRIAIDKLLPTIRAARDPLTRDLYLARLADVSHLDKVTLSTEADAVTEQGRRRAPGGPPERSSDEPMPEFEGSAVDAEPAPLPPPDGDKPVWKSRKNSKYGGGPEWKTTNIPPRPRRDEPVERSLVRAMLADRGIAERVAERHPPSSFRHAQYGALFAALLDAPMNDDLDQIADRLAPDALAVLRELTDGAVAINVEASDIGLSLSKLDARVLEFRVDEIREAMRTATREAQDALMKERLELEAEIRRLLPIRSPRAKPKG